MIYGYLNFWIGFELESLQDIQYFVNMFRAKSAPVSFTKITTGKLLDFLVKRLQVPILFVCISTIYHGSFFY